MAKRVLAVIGAVALVLVAIVVRGLIDDDRGGSGGSDGAPPEDDVLVLACDKELVEVCEAVDGARVVEQSSAETSAVIVEGGADDIDAWVTTDVWLEVTAGRTERSLGTAERLARSPVVVGVVRDRSEAVEALCDGASLWRCLGDNAGRPWSELGGRATWGPLLVGMPAADSAVGLSVLSAAAIGYFESSDFVRNDFDTNVGFGSWLSRLTDASEDADPDPLETMVTRAGSYSAAAGLRSRLEDLSTSRPLEALEPSPPVDSTLVILDLPGGSEGPSPDAMREALTAAGWSAVDGSPGRVLADGVAGALLTRWQEATR